MGEIAESLINGEFDYITGEYLGEAVGYPRTHTNSRSEYFPLYRKSLPAKQMFASLICVEIEALTIKKRLNWLQSFFIVEGTNNCLIYQSSIKSFIVSIRTILESS